MSIVVAAVALVAAAAIGGNASGAGAPCRASQLTASLALQGATGHLVGPLVVRNRSNAACTLRGRPRVTLRAPDGRLIPTRRYDARPSWSFISRTPPRGWPVVRVGPRARAAALITLTNWCRTQGERVRFDFALPDRGGGLSVVAAIRLRCEASKVRLSVGVGPFEPARR